MTAPSPDRTETGGTSGTDARTETGGTNGPGGTDETREAGDRVDVVVTDGDASHVLRVVRGRSLCDALSDAGLSPYAPLTARLNCGGRGLCATCGVRIREGPPADHWHDRLAERFGYPRLSCQVTVEEPMSVALVEKRVWGGRERDGGDEAPTGDADGDGTGAGSARRS